MALNPTYIKITVTSTVTKVFQTDRSKMKEKKNKVSVKKK